MTTRADTGPAQGRRSWMVLPQLCAVLCLVLAAACSSAPPQAAGPEQPPAKAPSLGDLIASGDSEGIKTYFANQEQLNSPDSEGLYPLHRAVDKGSPQLLDLLIALGAKVDVRDSAGKTPLRRAVDSGSLPCATLLASKGADPFSTDSQGRSVADAILAGGAMIDAVFSGANVNAHGSDGRTALHLAADRLLVDATTRLLADGADPNLRDTAGHSPLDLALLHPDRIEAAQIAEALILKGSAPSYPGFSWFVQAAKAVDYNSIRYADGGTPIHEATSQKQTGFLLFLLSRKVNPNTRDSSGSTALHVAMRVGWLEGAEILLKAGADPNARDAFDNTPLHIALPQDPKQDGVALLLKYGADPSLKDRNGNTPLHVAVQLGYPLTMVQDLIDAKAPVNSANAAGDSPLLLAVRAKRYEYAKPLLDAGADIFLVNGRGESALSTAVAAGPDALGAIITGRNAQAKDNYGNGCIAIAVGLKASPDCIALLVSRGADPSARNNAGDTALHIAVRQNLKEQGEALLLSKADIFASNDHGETPLSLALTARPGPVDWLFTPATLALRDSNGDTALHHAASRNLWQSVPYLVAKGALVDAPNSAGETPLHAAAKADAAESIKALLAQGAGLSARDAMGNTALHSAVLWSAHKSLAVLIQSGASLDARDFAGETALHLAVQKKDRPSLGFLLGKGADPDARDNRGVGPLASAVRGDSVDLARDLLAAGADPNARDGGGRSALLEAVDAGSAGCSQLLVGAGGDILARDAEGESPLTLALKRGTEVLKAVLQPQTVNRSDPDGRSCLRIIVESKPSPEAVELAIAVGAKVDIRDRYADTVLIAALRSGNLDLAARLVKAGADLFARNRDGDSPATLLLAMGDDALKAITTISGIGVADALGNTLLHYAAIAGNAKAVTWLLGAGADRSLRNIAGETASDVAAKRGNVDLAAVLKPGS
ncbi:MAG TPA: ankyrin repeat domain-containing protein [Rectinemataceae bacterium]|nr:ankyrin repeat domain-containing protein [Rectinemataceae bacterium]